MNSLFETILGVSVVPWKVILILLLSFVFGFVFALAYMFAKKKENVTKDFPVALVTFPFVCSAMMLLSMYLAQFTQYDKAAMAVAGVFIMTRFRSSKRPTDDLVYIFFSSTVGIALGLGFIGFAAIIEVLLIAVMVILTLVGFPYFSSKYVVVKITVPESLDYQDAFEDIFTKYTSNHSFEKVKTSDMGSIFVVYFNAKLKKDCSTKAFIDELRERNGNLDIRVTKKEKVEND